MTPPTAYQSEVLAWPFNNISVKSFEKKKKKHGGWASMRAIPRPVD